MGTNGGSCKVGAEMTAPLFSCSIGTARSAPACENPAGLVWLELHPRWEECLVTYQYSLGSTPRPLSPLQSLWWQDGGRFCGQRIKGSDLNPASQCLVFHRRPQATHFPRSHSKTATCGWIRRDVKLHTCPLPQASSRPNPP